MFCSCLFTFVSPVSLFTREWIEIVSVKLQDTLQQSPSLRGSGLKYLVAAVKQSIQRRLPLYEGVD